VARGGGATDRIPPASSGPADVRVTYSAARSAHYGGARAQANEGRLTEQLPRVQGAAQSMAEKITSKLNVRANKEANVAGGMINAGVADSVLKRARQKRAEETALNDKATKTKPKENPKRVDKMVEMVPAETTTVEAEKQVSLMDKMRSLQRKVFK